MEKIQDKVKVASMITLTVLIVKHLPETLFKLLFAAYRKPSVIL
jgi:hypothetical protein